jgi:Ser/Thr protein kinase RdoA (MazF antagonist)
MSAESKVRELLSGLPVPLKSPVRVEKLDGGLTNQVYRISAGDTDFVLRLGHKQPGLPDISCELSILGHAAGTGLGPKVEYVDSERGILLLEFLPGRSWEREDLLLPEKLEDLARLLRGVHALPGCGIELDMAGLAEANARAVFRRDELRGFGATCLDIVNEQRSFESIACCHNDVVAENVVAGDSLQLIDWEWAADNDPMFDVASIIAYHDLEPSHADTLLVAYAGGADASLRERVQEQLRLFDALQWLWLAAREAARTDPGQLSRLKALRSRIAA